MCIVSTLSNEAKWLLTALLIVTAFMNSTWISGAEIRIEECPQEIIFSGMWKDVPDVITNKMRFISQTNCDLYITNNGYRIKPRAVGACAVVVEDGKNRKRFSWTVIQAPGPAVQLGPLRRKGIIDWNNPGIYFIVPHMADASDSASYHSPGRLYSYKEKIDYSVSGFTMRIFDQKDALVYYSTEYDDRFSCKDFDAFRFYIAQKGTKVVIDSVNVYFPDRTWKVVAMDTLFAENWPN